jgi:putative transposase
MGEYLKLKVMEITKYYPEIDIVEVNIDKDHMHVLLSIPPQMSVSQAVNVLKTNTGKAMRKKFSFLSKVCWGSGGNWSIGYFVSTDGINE